MTGHQHRDEYQVPDQRLLRGGTRGRRRSRAVIVAVMAVVGIAGGALQFTSGRQTREMVVPPPRYAPEWESLPDAPLDGRAGASSVWTGDRLIIWGGGLTAPMGLHPDQDSIGYVGDRETPGRDTELGRVLFADGASFDPDRGTWHPIADAPFASGERAQAVWTGSEMIVLTSGADASEIVVAAYRPGVDRWRLIDHPVGDGAVLEMVWTGSEVLLWGSFDHQAARGDIGYAYQPDRGRWRELRDAPVPARQWHTVVWTGDEMVVWGGTDLTGRADEKFEDAAYDPSSDTWRVIADAPISDRHGHTAVWTGEEMLVWSGQTMREMQDGAAYDPTRDAWRKLPAAPVAGRIGHVAVWDGRGMVVWGGRTVRGERAFADGAAYLPDEDRWLRLPPASLGARCAASAAATSNGVVLWGGTTRCDVEGHGQSPSASDGAEIRTR